MLDDFIRSIREQVVDRVASPLMGSVLISWGIWNYKFLVILFSAESVLKTFHLIETVAFPDAGSIVVRGILMPLITAALYIFAYPYPAKFVYGFTRQRQIDLNELRQKIENETPLTLEESRKIRSDVIASERGHREETEKLNSEISRLRSQVELVQGSAKPSETTETRPIEPIIDENQLNILLAIESRGGDSPEYFLIQKSSAKKVKVEFDLGELVARGLLDKYYDQDDEEDHYRFTHEGRRALIAANTNTD